VEVRGDEDGLTRMGVCNGNDDDDDDDDEDDDENDDNDDDDDDGDPKVLVSSTPAAETKELPSTSEAASAKSCSNSIVA
jgi:hypothetical protein